MLIQKYYDKKLGKSKMPPKKKATFVLHREREEILHDFRANLKSEDDYDNILERRDSESEDGDKDRYENVDIDVKMQT